MDGGRKGWYSPRRPEEVDESVGTSEEMSGRERSDVLNMVDFVRRMSDWCLSRVLHFTLWIWIKEGRRFFLIQVQWSAVGNRPTRLSQK